MRWPITIIVALLGGFAFALLVFLMHDSSAELRASIEVVLKRKLNLPNASISQEFLAGRRETDPDGFWAVELGDESLNLEKALANSEFGKSDDDDNRFFRSTIEKAFGKALPNGYRSYEANLALGDGTICPSTLCNIVILFATDEQTMYVQIWKN